MDRQGCFFPLLREHSKTPEHFHLDKIPVTYVLINIRKSLDHNLIMKIKKYINKLNSGRICMEMHAIII